MASRRRTTRLPGHLAPPGPQASARLTLRVAAITLARLRAAERRLAMPLLRGILPRGASLLRGAEELVRELGTAGRLQLLHGPDLRGFLSEIETWSEVLLLAARDTRRRTDLLFDRISRTEHLVDLVPSGRLDAGFPARAAELAASRLREALDDLPAILLGARLAFLGGRGSFAARLATRESAEQGRPTGRADLGTFSGPAGPLALVGVSLRVRLASQVLAVRSGRLKALFPQPASPLRFPWNRNGPDGGSSMGRKRELPHLVRRRLIPGTPILIAPAVRSGPRRLRVGHDLPGIDERLATALRLVHLAWPEAHREILGRTAIVVPVREPGLVSYSLAARPGVSFINVHGKRIVDLADDLLHETAHHLLHDVQETAALLARGPETGEVQAFDSPWRGARRPLHGLLHGTYTFLFRAELLSRLLREHSRRPRIVGPLLGPGGVDFLRRERRLELGMIRRALKDLDQASRSRLITPAGGTLVRSLRTWHSRLARTRRQGRQRLDNWR